MTWNIKKHLVEFLEEEHQYLVDGVCVPSITQIMKLKFGGKYDGIAERVLNNARMRGVRVHKEIEDYFKKGIESDSEELYNFKFLQKQFEFEVVKNEVPVILFKNDKPIACGKLDLVLKRNNQLGLGDIKTTSSLDKEYLAYQLNLYKIAYEQSYDEKIEFLAGIHLRFDKRKYIELPIKSEMVWELVDEYLNETDTSCNGLSDDELYQVGELTNTDYGNLKLNDNAYCLVRDLLNIIENMKEEKQKILDEVSEFYRLKSPAELYEVREYGE